MSADDMRTKLAQSPEAAAALIAAGARSGLAEAQAAYGQILLDGRGVRRDPEAAVRWFGAAAKAGHAMAANMVGRCYEKGWGVAEDRTVAAAWYRAAAEAGLDWGMYNYGSALGLGAGVAKDEVAALGWFRKAAAIGHAKSINFVGDYHEEGRLVPRDMRQAAECYRLAAEGGDFRGQFNHARMLADAGRVEEARMWLMRANETCSEAFREVMRGYFAGSAHEILRRIASQL
ncbi:tetratricopeptide repeat protein [Sphingomonas sp. MMS24-J13]|uniref:tetratricopeptide repeat protein n=1 Tax=Sphingomonas sp. MMS24-J13 TaxID=3238686 RepID=UPI0038502C87